MVKNKLRMKRILVLFLVVCSFAAKAQYNDTGSIGSAIRTHVFGRSAGKAFYTEEIGKVLQSMNTFFGSAAPASIIPAAYDSNSVANIVRYGADSTGVSNSNAALVAAAATGKPILFPRGNFWFTAGVTLGTNQSVIGVAGNQSRIRMTGNFTLFTIGGNGVTISNIFFKGDNSSTQRAISLSDKVGWHFFNNNFESLGRGMWLASINTPLGRQTKSGIVSANYFDSCKVGIYMDGSAEYVRIWGNHFNNADTGLYCESGNVTIDNNQFGGNKLGLHLKEVANGAHGSIQNNTFNHNESGAPNTAMILEDIELTQLVQNNQIWYGHVYLDNSKGVNFSHNVFSPGGFNLQLSGSSQMWGIGNVFRGGYPVIADFGGTNSIYFPPEQNYFVDATTGAFLGPDFTATDASFALAEYYSTIKLPTITANRVITLSASQYSKNRIIKILNENSTGFNWSFSGTTVKDKTGATVTTLANDTWYHLWYDGTQYQIINL